MTESSGPALARRRATIRGAFEDGIAGSLATGLAGQLVLVVSGILVARALGVDGRGQLAVIVLVPSVLSQLGTFGIPVALTYYIARNPASGRALLQSLRRLIGAQAVALTAAQAGILWLLGQGDERTAMLAAIPIMPALVAQQYGLAVLQGEQRFTAFNVLRVAPATLYALALVGLFLVDTTSLLVVVAAWTITNVLVGCALAVVAIRYAAPGRGHSSEHRIRTVIRYGSSAILGSSSPAEILRVDQAIIALTLSRSALGLYVVALAFTNLPRFFSQSVGVVAYPRIAAATAAAARELLRGYLLLVVVVAGLSVAVLEIAVVWLMPRLFGADFAGAVTTAQILLVAAFLLAVRRVLTDIGQGLGSPSSGTLAEVVNLCVALPLVAIAAPRWGIEGAATALALGAAASLAALALLVRHRIHRAGSVDPADEEAQARERAATMALDRGGPGS